MFCGLTQGRDFLDFFLPSTLFKFILIQFQILFFLSQKHEEWLNKRKAERISAEKHNVGHHDPKQRIRFFKHLIKLNNDTENEVAFIPHSPPRSISHRPSSTSKVETNESINRSIAKLDDSTKSEHEQIDVTTVIIDTGNKFAYDTVPIEQENNRKIEIDNAEDSTRENISNDDKEARSTAAPEAISNDIRELNQRETTDDDTKKIENQLEKHHHRESRVDAVTADDGMESGLSNRKTVNPIDSTKSKTESSSDVKSHNNTTSNNNYETQRFISELIKYKADNVTIKKSWGKWSEWSGCSRSCGEGVMFQKRECMKKT